jgi:hypothetical protein
MKIYTKLVWDMASGDLLHEESFDYDGPVAQCKGATREEKDLAAQQAAFYRTLTGSYNQQFAGQAAILKSLQDAWAPILAAGPSQEGFSAEERQALNTQAIEGTGQEYQKAIRATKEAMAARGGGQEDIGSGADQAILGSIATTQAADAASKRLQIALNSRERGYQNFIAASKAMSGNASVYNPVGFAGAANQGGDSAFNSAKTIQEQNAASSPWGAVGGILGGAASAFAGGFGGALGTRMGGGKKG